MAKYKGSMTKKEAVRQALADLGPDAKPTQLQDHIKKKFSIDMTRGHIAVTKREIRNAAAGKKKTRGKAKKTPAQGWAARQVEAAPLARAEGATQRVGLDDVEAVKGLLDRLGASSLRRLIDLMAH
jgi:hypothetical protein